jgi:hypothetical protein
LQKNGKRRVNTSQNVPRASLELKENSHEYQMFIEALGPIFQWINQLVWDFLLFFSGVDLFSGESPSSRLL